MSQDVKDTNQMEERKYYENSLKVEGFVDEEPEYHHETHGEKIYRFNIRIPRKNRDAFDLIPVEVSERAVDISDIKKGSLIRVCGQFRSFNKVNNDTNKVSLSLSIFARDVVCISKEDLDGRYENLIHLKGNICKEPIFRVTPNGREIGDVILAVQRVYGRNDYIPCIAWSRNARYISGLEVGTGISLTGRIQSRNYYKFRGTDKEEFHTVYEVSISELSVTNKPKEKTDSDTEKEEQNTPE